MQNMGIVELKNEHTAVQLNLDGGGIIWSIANYHEDISPPQAIQFIDSTHEGHDSFGLSVQAAYWDPIIKDIHYNPTQGGDIHDHGSGVIKADYIGPSTGKSVTYNTKTLALHFHPKTSYVDPATSQLAPNPEGKPVRSDITVEQWVTLKGDGVVKVKYKLTNISPQPHGQSLQQVPVFHLLKNFNAYYTQLGPDKFETKPIPSHPPAETERIQTPEKWINIYDPSLNNFGLTIYSDTSKEFCISNKGSVVMCQPYLFFGLKGAMEGVTGFSMEHTVILIPGTPLKGRKYLVDNGYVSAKIG